MPDHPATNDNPTITLASPLLVGVFLLSSLFSIALGPPAPPPRPPPPPPRPHLT